jgi:hypothetical protein
MIVSVFDPLAVLLLIAANWQQRQDKKPVVIDEGTLPEVPEPQPVLEPTKTISISVGDEIVVDEETHITPNVEEPTEEDLDIKVDESKDWEAVLYDRVDSKKEELSSSKARNFLSKAKDVFTTGVKTIETEVEEIQNNK